MEIINNLTNEPKQRFQLYVDEEILYINLYYYVTQQSWFFDIEYKDYVCRGMRVTLTPNALRHLTNILPFGISFFTNSNAEPYNIDDFSSKRVIMILLSKDEVAEIESEIFQ